jgi:hypothetical protein
VNDENMISGLAGIMERKKYRIFSNAGLNSESV